MRKLLLATTALFGGVALAGAAQAMPAPTSPITLNVGGYVDFVAGFYHEAQGIDTRLPRASAAPAGAASADQLASRDFETEYKINFDAMGKAANGMQYGANVSLWNGPEATNLWTGGGSSVELASAYVWLSGSFGKALFGDEHGATDLFFYAPTVGEGQIDGRYMDFTSPFLLARMQASGVDNTEHSTNVTYYTPKVGNDNHKVQLGITYEPNMYDYGSDVVKNELSNPNVTGSNLANGYSPYQDVVKGDLAQYSGNFHPVNVAASGKIITGSGGANNDGPRFGMFAFVPKMLPVAVQTTSRISRPGVLVRKLALPALTVGGSYVDDGPLRHGTWSEQGPKRYDLGRKV